jgi:hypothetical protein
MAIFTLWFARELVATERRASEQIEPSPRAKVEVSTIGSGPSTLTSSEIEKWVQSQAGSLAEPSSNPGKDAVPVVAEKPQDKCTIEVGPPGLNAAERAKAGLIDAKEGSKSQGAGNPLVGASPVD